MGPGRSKLLKTPFHWNSASVPNGNDFTSGDCVLVTRPPRTRRLVHDLGSSYMGHSEAFSTIFFEYDSCCTTWSRLGRRHWERSMSISALLGYSNIPLIYQLRRTFHGMRNGVASQDDGVVHIVKVLQKLAFIEPRVIASLDKNEISLSRIRIVSTILARKTLRTTSCISFSTYALGTVLRIAWCSGDRLDWPQGR